MAYVVVGLGAIGGTIAARLSLAGRDVVGVARGAHGEAVRRDGLLLRTPSGDHRVPLDVRPSVRDVGPGIDDVVVVATKSQDSEGVLTQLADVAPPGTAVVCAQNGVTNEPEALRWFERVYGMVVMCPALHLEPGVVAAYSEPVVGILDVGRFPGGEDDVSRGLAGDLSDAGFDSRSVPDIARWKYAKLLTNLGNAVEAVCGPAARGGPLTERLQQEGRAVLGAHGIAYASAAEDRERRGDLIRRGDIDGPRPGGSVWQSVARGAPTTEVDYLCGEIARLARLLGRSAPANALLQQLTHDISAGRTAAESTTEEQVLARLDQELPSS